MCISRTVEGHVNVGYWSKGLQEDSHRRSSDGTWILGGVWNIQAKCHSANYWTEKIAGSRGTLLCDLCWQDCQMLFVIKPMRLEGPVFPSTGWRVWRSYCHSNCAKTRKSPTFAGGFLRVIVQSNCRFCKFLIGYACHS
jgi:hypothetical protein